MGDRAPLHGGSPPLTAAGERTSHDRFYPRRSIARSLSKVGNLAWSADDEWAEVLQMRESSSPAHRISDQSGHDRFYRGPHDRRLSREPIGFHVTIRLEDDRPIATTQAALRVVARVVLGQGEERGLLAFGAAADHLHAALATDRASAGAFARYVETALVWRLGLGARFERARIRPLQDQKHAYNTFHYAHRQDSRHELDLDRAREATSLPDLLGLRVLGTSVSARVREHLPRIRREDLVGQFPAGAFDVVAPIDLDVLAEAAAAALALADLCGRSVDTLRARRAAVHVAGPDVPSRRLSDCLGIGVRAVQSLRTQRREPSVIRAVEQQVSLLTKLGREALATLA